MGKVPAACLVLAALAAPAHALELKNARAVYGPFGPDRTDNRFLPGDSVFLTFDIADVQVDPKTNTARYHITTELADSKGALVFRRNKNDEGSLSLGGGQIPAFADVLIGTDQAPGKYTLKVTVRDALSKSAKALNYGFDVEPESFGFVRVFAPGAAFTGQNYAVNFAVIGMARDDKKNPSVDIHMQVLDDTGKMVFSQASAIPKDLPEEELSKIATLPFIPLQYAMFLNRPGRFTVELQGTDKLGKKSAKMRIPLTVVDVSSLISK